MDILIVDDEKNSRGTIKKMLERMEFDNLSLREAESVATAGASIRAQKPDLILLDIQLKDGNGFEVLRDMVYTDIPVIFITAYEEFAVKAFKFSALDYLLKPIMFDEFSAAVKRAGKRIEREKIADRMDLFMQHFRVEQPSATIALKTTESIHIVPIDDILYCEASGSYTKFYLKDQQKIMVSKTLSDYEELINRSYFLRVHQSFLVNMKHAIRYERGENGVLVNSNGDKIPVSSRRKELVLNYIQNM
ncbi:response regulator transcription factor [Crocinitomicaceae bacterium CZZ-1]|uniref:Response regulator transcription factor n=1 Tax=Taishania pollutisoli TaxID=2766479 RepID=A0A8J6TZE5_9FLAO|nr:LytTR family DNA-binding domain-containing protein [Taishania pollutisoli]MBC9812023.1 response regulator transcription factor [Taishania pollutisoli]MBX2949901.1 response regulator transcription factor [Crocinitomicaceae bacterium]NGF74820.1 response regulator transcription factor [Fluviicola sp. SGL-29]